MQNTLTQLFRFALVGAAGFIIDTGWLYAMLALGLNAYAGRVVSYIAAATFTWALNRRFTFKTATTQNAKKQWATFLLLNLGGGAVNYGTYALLISLSPLVASYPVLGVAAGSITGLFVNFGLNKFIVFKA